MASIRDPRTLFVHKLGATLTMEKTSLEMLETLEQKATDSRVRQQFSQHVAETEGQIRNLEQAFVALGRQPQRQPAPAIDTLEREADELLDDVSEQLVDAVLLDGAAETEHHEIAVYEALITQAEALGEDDVVPLLQENLEQEQHTLHEVRRHSERLAQQLANQSA
jgi:ferritin-like metal-binding protein YciE